MNESCVSSTVRTPATTRVFFRAPTSKSSGRGRRARWLSVAFAAATDCWRSDSRARWPPPSPPSRSPRTHIYDLKMNKFCMTIQRPAPNQMVARTSRSLCSHGWADREHFPVIRATDHSDKGARPSIERITVFRRCCHVSIQINR